MTIILDGFDWIVGDNFVTRKITRSVAKIHLQQQETLELGCLHSKRDWGHARDYIEAMWLMLQHDTPEDFVIATGMEKSYSSNAKIHSWDI